ncbi:MAG: zinc ribbon domain-containing protein [Candidatus Thorarchaeota archaeon]
MARVKGVTIAVKVPINLDVMTKRTKQRLRQIVGRDTRVIRSFLGVIEQHEEKLLIGKKHTKISDGELDKLTMTALKVKNGQSQRLLVPHDFKARFPRISQNEIIECRQTAVANYESYLELRRTNGRRASRPCEITSSRRIPRWAFSQRFKLIEKTTSVARWWVNLRDALDSVSEGRKIHDRLMIPLKMSPFHLNQLNRGKVKALQVFTDRYRKWWLTFAVRIDELPTLDNDLPVAVLGIDLGIAKAVCVTLVTPEKVRDTKYFKQEDKIQSILRLDRLVADLQHEMDIRKNSGLMADKIVNNLRRLRSKRENVAKEYDRILVRQLIEYISGLSESYTLYVALGKLKNIRCTARKGNYRGRRFRGMIHRWAFARITESLKHGLSQIGWTLKGKTSRFRVVPEQWTSIMCWKCGSKGKRPRQNQFYCSSCGHQTNADRNGAINIAGRLITLTKSLHDVRGLGKWASSVVRGTTGRSARLKTQKKISKKSSKGKSLLSKKGTPSRPGESAAVHFAQSSLHSFGDETKMSDNDPAVGRTVETLSVAGSDTPAAVQEEEARNVGGTPSR